MQKTKAEIIQECERLAKEYLGIPVELPGKNKPKSYWIERMHAYQKMVQLNNQAKEILKRYDNRSFIYYSLSNNMPEDLAQARELRQKANEIWLTH